MTHRYIHFFHLYIVALKMYYCLTKATARLQFYITEMCCNRTTTGRLKKISRKESIMVDIHIQIIPLISIISKNVRPTALLFPIQVAFQPP